MLSLFKKYPSAHLLQLSLLAPKQLLHPEHELQILLPSVSVNLYVPSGHV